MTLKHVNVSERLSHAFAEWQMFLLWYEMEVASLNHAGTLTQQDVLDSQIITKLPHTILDNSIKNLNIDDWKLSKIELCPDNLRGSHHAYELFPYELFKWNRNSRRVFHLPTSLKTLLETANLPNITWDDILWPFDSFIVTIEEPITINYPDKRIIKFDTIMVTKTNSVTGGYLTLRWIQTPTKSGQKFGFNDREIELFRRNLKNRKIKEMRDFWDKKYETQKELFQSNTGSQSINFNINWNTSQKIITETNELIKSYFGVNSPTGIERSFCEALSAVLRIVVGWMLYLESLPKNTTEWRKPDKKGNLRSMGGLTHVITNPENICDIAGKSYLSTSETMSSGQRNHKGFVRPHWRIGYRRRNSEKKIPPVLVRADLVPLYGIVGGTTTIVNTEE